MVTRYNNKPGGNKINSGYTDEIAEDFSMPSCTIEDVDRGIFNLFDKELPFFYGKKDEQKRVPVVFATGERFALLSRNKPLRDKNDALILPLVSIVRTGIDQESAKGASQFQDFPITIKMKLAEDDALYQRLINKQGFKNADDLAIGESYDQLEETRVKTAREPSKITVSSRKGTVLNRGLGKNIYEFIEIPPIKQYTATYDITFWTQYTQEMNSMLTTMMNGYVENRMRTFVIQTEKGYKFLAFVDSALNPQNNFEDFTDAERLVKYSFSVSVAAFIVAPQIPGVPSPFRKVLSAPDISFDISIGDIQGSNISQEGVPSGNAQDYILQDMSAEDEGSPKQSIPKNSLSAEQDSSKEIFNHREGTSGMGISAKTDIITDVDPFSNKKEKRYRFVSFSIPNKGEVVYKFIF